MAWLSVFALAHYRLHFPPQNARDLIQLACDLDETIQWSLIGSSVHELSPCQQVPSAGSAEFDYVKAVVFRSRWNLLLLDSVVECTFQSTEDNRSSGSTTCNIYNDGL